VKSKETQLAYLEQFYATICIDEADGVHEFITDDDGNDYDITDETDAKVLDRIQRSKKAGRNLFFEECPPYTPSYEDGANY